MSKQVLLKVDQASKKFCRDLRRSLWYGVQDSVGDLLGRGGHDAALRRDEFWAVNNVSFELNRGECIGLIGHNGAGKTTLLKMLSGLVKPDRGRIEIRGRLGALIALGAGFNPVLTGRENIYVNGSVLGLTKREIDAKYDEIVDFADIGEFIDSPVQNYSSGMQVRLGFAIAVAVKPDVLLLDEVLAVGDANFQAKCFNVLANFRKDGTSFVLVSHNAHMITRYCQRALYMSRGHPLYLGKVETALAMLGKEMAEKGARGDHEGPDWSVARGSGRIRLTSGQFLDSHGRPASVVRVGEPLTLALGYERLDPAVRDVQLDVVIRDANQTVYQGDNLSSGQPLTVAGQRGTFHVDFDYLAWNAEHLNFFITMMDPASGEIHDWKRNFRLDTSRHVLNQGSVSLPTRWCVKSDVPVVENIE